MKLITGQIYYDIKNKAEVEFRYIGGEGDAIVCEPGDSGGGMQSCWAISASNLKEIEVASKKLEAEDLMPLLNQIIAHLACCTVDENSSGSFKQIEVELKKLKKYGIRL